MKKFLYIILGLTISIPFGYSQTINPLSFLSRVSSTDKTPGYLLSKFVAGSGVILTQNNTGGNESITISASSTGGGGSLSGGVAKWLAYWTSSTTLSAVATGTVGSFLTASTSASGYDWTASSTVSSLLNYWTKSSNNLYYTAGNIGVGTTTPGYPLTVVGTSSLATTTGVFWDMGGQVYNVKSYGAKCDGVTDDTTAINATIAAAASSTGGVILFPIGRCLQNGAVIIPYTGASPTQVPLRFTGLGQTNNGYWASSPINGGSIWDLRYDGTDGLHPAKIDTRGAGTLEIDHLTIASGGTDNFLIMQTTNTTVFVHENAIIGNPNNTGDGNLQDFLQMGSTTATIGSGAGAPFQGYGSVVSKNYYSHIRTGIRFGNFANGIEVDNETYSTTCGSSNASSSPYYFAPGAIGSNGGNRINGSTIEMTHYSYMTVVEGNSTYNRFNDMGGYDQGSHTAGGFYFSSDAVINRVLIGYWENNHPIVSGAGSAHTTIIGSAPGEPSYFPDGISGDGIPAVNQVNTWTASQHFAWQSTIFGQGNSSSTKNYILLGDLDDNNNVWLQALSVSNPDIGIKMMTKGNGAFEIVNGNLYVSSTTANSLFGGNLKVNGEISNANGDLKLQNMTTYQLIQSYNSKPLVLNQFGNNIGIGSTTTPSQPLTVIGNQYLGGALFDGSNASGTNGMILQSTGTGIRWVATSSAIAAYTGTYPIIVNGSTISSGFSTSTVNNFTAQNTFTTASSTGFTANTLYSTLANLINASTTGLSASLLFVSSTSTLATTTISGNLGIGTLVPQQKLHVNSGVTYQGILINGNAAPNVGFASNAGLTPIWKVGLSGNVGTNLSISSGAANTDVMSFSGSNVGIGTTTPGSKLTVQGNTLLQGTGVLNPLTIASSTGTTLFQVLANGNVGVGSSSPSSLLTVVSTSSMRAILPETTLTYDLGASTSRWNSGWINTLNLGTSTFSIGQPTTNRLGFFTLAEKAGTEALSIFTDGKVGIGSTSPSDLLTVQGSINVTGSVKVNGVPLSAGSGLTSLNGQTGSTQTFATTTAGTDFSVTSSGDVHTFAMPSASASARGLLTSSDFTTFTNKPSFSYASSSFVDLISNQTIGGNKTFTGTTNLTNWTGSNGTSSVLAVPSFLSFLNATGTGLTLTNLFSSNSQLGNATATTFFTTTGSSSLFRITNASTTNLSILGQLNDINGTDGLAGQVLLSTGTSTQWTSTSSLGITGGGGSLSGGTTGLLALWSSATTLTTSLFIDNGTVTGIGATSSTERFNIASTTGNTMFSVGVNGQLSIATTTAATTTLTDISLPSLVQKWFSATVLPGLEKLFVTQASSTPASFAFDEMSVARSRITPGSGTTYNLDNVGAVTSGCTVLKLAPSAVLNAIFASYRIRHSSVVTTPNQICGVFVTNETQFFRGGTNTTQNIGGFNFFARVSIDNWTAGNRLFVGLTASTTPISGTSTLAGVRDTVGFGIHQGSTTLTLMSNNASGNVTETTLTGVPAIQAGMGYDLYLYAAPNSDRISYRVDNASTSQIMTTGVITTDLPTKTTMMRPFAAMSNATNTPANSAQFGIARIIIETRK